MPTGCVFLVKTLFFIRLIICTVNVGVLEFFLKSYSRCASACMLNVRIIRS